jgi:hypothetical protein
MTELTWEGAETTYVWDYYNAPTYCITPWYARSLVTYIVVIGSTK